VNSITDPIDLQYSWTTEPQFAPETIAYLSTLNIASLQLAPTGGPPVSVDWLPSLVANLSTAVDNVQSLQFNSLKGQPSLDNNILERTIAQLPALVGIALQHAAYTELPQLVPNPAQLKWLAMTGVPLIGWPAWLTNATSLLYLKVTAPNATAAFDEWQYLNTLPALEYFILTTSALDHLPDTGILAQSVRLRLLDLSCNQLTSLPADVFDHMQQLQVYCVVNNVD
jgi:hypothetical protein